MSQLAPDGSLETIDLNADLGESFGRWSLGDDDAMLPLVTSANIACGFHAGDPTVLLNACTGAVTHGVRIGAQVGYRDLAGFGRRFIEVPPTELTTDVLYQLGALDGLARVAGDRVRYVKPHGALYNAIVHHRAQAAAVVEAVCRYDASLPVVTLPDSVFGELAADAGLTVIREAFADRGYAADGTLLPRGQAGALITDPDQVAARAVQMARDGLIRTATGAVISVAPQTICLHSDTPGAIELAEAVRTALAAAGITVRPFG